MVKDQFVGTWRLVSSEFRSSDGVVSYPLGTDAVGIVMYDVHGNMAVQIMTSDRPKFASEDRQMGTPDETKAALDGYVAYFGSYEVKEAEKVIIHHMKGSVFPNWVGQDQKRFYEFAGNRLTLTTPPTPSGGVVATGVLVWELIS